MTEHPPPITNLLDQEEQRWLAERLAEVFADTGFGRVVIKIHERKIVGIEITKFTRRGNDNNSRD